MWLCPASVKSFNLSEMLTGKCCTLCHLVKSFGCFIFDMLVLPLSGQSKTK